LRWKRSRCSPTGRRRASDRRGLPRPRRRRSSRIALFEADLLGNTWHFTQRVKRFAIGFLEVSPETVERDAGDGNDRLIMHAECWVKRIRMVRERSVATQPDLVGVVLLTVALNAAVFVPSLRETPLRVPLGLLFTLFVPGYALVAAVYPDQQTGIDPVAEDPIAGDGVSGSGITLLERLLLSVACSVVLVPAVGYAFNFTSIGVRLGPVLLTTSALTVLLAAVAAGRRRVRPVGVRFEPPTPWLGSLDALRRRDLASMVGGLALVGAVMFFLVSLGSVGVDVASSESYSEAYLLSQDGDELVGANGSRTLEAGAPASVQLALENHRDDRTNYTVVVLQQTVTIDDGGVTAVRNQRRIDRFAMTVPVEEATSRESTFRTAEAAGPSRVVWLVYVGEEPSTPSIDTADYHVYLWVEGVQSDVERLQATTVRDRTPTVSKTATSISPLSNAVNRTAPANASARTER